MQRSVTCDFGYVVTFIQEPYNPNYVKFEDRSGTEGKSEDHTPPTSHYPITIGSTNTAVNHPYAPHRTHAMRRMSGSGIRRI